MPTTSPRDSMRLTMELTMLLASTSTLRPRVDRVVAQLAGGVQRPHGGLEGGGHAVVDLDVAERRGAREEHAALAPGHQDAGRHGLAADRRRRGVLTGVADLVAVQNARVEAVRRGHRNAPGERSLDVIVIGADLRRGDDQAVQGRVLHDLVDDLQLARDVVDRRLGAEHQQVDAERPGRHQRARIGRIEEAVAGGVGDDGEGQLAVLGMEVLGPAASLDASSKL